MDFFNSAKPLKRVFITPGARMLRLRNAQSEVASTCSTSSTCTGTEYVEEYLKHENQLLKESSSLYRPVTGPSGTDFDQISLSTAASSNVHFDETLEKIYNTYNVQYTPSTSMSICSVRDKIVNMVSENPVTIIQGPTGCGKTTQVPQYILDDCARKRAPCNIIVTQPRRIAAMSIAKRVAEERNWHLGSLVGFRVSLINATSDETRLTYCTTGVLLQRLVYDKHMNDYTHVIIDEIHERDQDMDFLLLIVRKFLRSNSRGVRVILMSATFNVDKFSNYFCFCAGPLTVKAPVIDVTKSNYYLVREFYLDDIPPLGERPIVNIDDPRISDKMMALSVSLMKILDRIDDEPEKKCEDRPSVLVFLPGIYEIHELYDLMDTPENERNHWSIVVLHSSITYEEQERIFIAPPKGYRRIILSTNIAESSLTVPNVKYVIDFCLTKQLITDSKNNYPMLQVAWASRANCQQRAGRTGRVMDGRVYRLVSKSFYKEVLNEESPPEIVRAPLENVYLKAKLLNIDKPKALFALCLDPPNFNNLQKAVLNLKETSALLENPEDPLDGEVTDLGRVMANLPLEIHVSKLIVLGQVFSVLRDAVIIGACMSAKSVFSAPFKERMHAYKAKLLWSRNTNSDAIAFLHAYRAWIYFKSQRGRDQISEVTWARKSFLQIRVLREIEAMVSEITERLENLGITETKGPARVTYSPEEQQFVIKVIIAGAFYPQYYMAVPQADDRESVKELGGLDPAKTIYLTGWPHNQPGMLYAKRFQEMFQNILTADSSRIAVKFDYSSRVYIQFNKTEVKDIEMPYVHGQIPGSVYQALKLRSIKQSLEVPVLDPEAASDRAEVLGLEYQVRNLFFPDKSRQIEEKSKMMRAQLPPLDVNEIRIKIQRAVDPAHFWAILTDEETKENMHRVRRAIDALGDLPRCQQPPRIGLLVIASTNRAGCFERAVVQSVALVSNDKYDAQVFFIDYGRIGKRAIRDLREVPDGSVLETIPAAAFQCVLSHVKPAIVNVLDEEWPAAARLAFRNIIAGKQLTGQVYSVVNSVVKLELLASDGVGPPLNVNDFLVHNVFAEKCEEDYLSKYNHQVREDFHNLSQEEKKSYEEAQYSQLHLADTYVEPPPTVECTQQVKLHGPFSPLEVKLTAMVAASVGCKININQTSVNSILLESSLSNAQEKLVVASEVTQGSKNGYLNLRSTTVMHNIPGLASLLTLIFAPKIELRANYLRTRYIGALCGLGFDKNSGDSLYPEHDIYFTFDVNVTVDDLQQINKLRYWMSLGIFVQDDDNNEISEAMISDETLKCQCMVKEVLFSLFNKKREMIKKEIDHCGAKWGRYPESDFMKPGQLNEYKKIIYKLHSALSLRPRNDAYEAMLTHLEELRAMASMSIKETRYKEIECNLCGQKINGILHLRTHITSAFHMNLEEEYMKESIKAETT